MVYFGTRHFERIVETDSNEFMILRLVGTIMLIGGAGLALGVSEAVAGFFVGMAFSSTSYVEDIEKLVKPFRDFFAAVFFFWIGLITDPMLFLGMIPAIFALVLLTAPTKLVTGYLSGKVYALSKVRSLSVGIGMTDAGRVFPDNRLSSSCRCRSGDSGRYRRRSVRFHGRIRVSDEHSRNYAHGTLWYVRTVLRKVTFDVEAELTLFLKIIS